jgi:hypothetical protein
MNASWRSQPLEQELERLQPATQLLIDLQKNAPPHHILRYEDMVAGHLQPLEKYLGCRLQQPFAVHKKVDRVARTRSSGSWQHWFTQEDEAVLAPLFAGYINAYKYAPAWTLAPEPNISAEHSTDYVRRIVNQRRAKEKLELI